MLILDTDLAEKRMRRYRMFLLITLFLCLLGIVAIKIYEIDGKIPSVIYVEDGQTTFNLEVPAKAELIDVANMEESNVSKKEMVIDLSQAVTIPSNGSSSYTLKVKLFGILPFKDMDVRIMENRELIPVGSPVGIYMETKGVMVVGTGTFQNETGEESSPSKNILISGDYIVSADDEVILDKEDFLALVEESQGNELVLGIIRGGQPIRLSVKPQKDITGKYKLGIWVRDNAQGVGTMTYIDSQGNFGALGHGINDIDTNQLMEISGGTVYDTRIVDIKKGISGEPGEMTGMIVYTDEHILGRITRNDSKGIFGECNDYALKKYAKMEALPVCLKQDIQKGYAQILCSVGDTNEYYDAEILAVHLDHDNVNRGIELKITDEKLLTATGGIIQGMSGSPIIQNGKIIGAVTHVLVNDPKRGYGIFIEEMIKE